MNILIIEDMASTTWGGAEKSMFDYAVHLNKKGNNVYFTYVRKGNWLQYANKNPFHGHKKINIGFVRQQGVIPFIRHLIYLRAFCKKNSIELILTHTIHGFFFLRIAKILIKKPLIVYFKWISNYKSIGSLNKWGANGISLAISSTNFVKKYWIKNGAKPKNGFYVVPDGIDLTKKHEQSIPKTSQIKNLLFLGRIYEGKGLHLILNAMDSYKEMNLKVAGTFNIDDPKNNKYKEYIEQLIATFNLKDRVEFLGNVNNPETLVANTDLVIVPSIWPEAQSRVVLESMALGKLVIASEIGGIPEVLGKIGEKLLFEPTVLGLRQKLHEIISLPESEKNRLIIELQQRFIKEYQMTVTHKKLDELITSMDKNQ